MAVSKRRAYVYWAVGGIFGLHHFYLGRDVQAFVWFVTFGGGIVGWLRDFRKIPKYVDEANGKTKRRSLKMTADREIMLQVVSREYLVRCCNPIPEASWTLFIGHMLLGVLFSVVFRLAIPVQLLVNLDHHEYLTSVLVTAATEVGSALGVFLASNISPYKVSIGSGFNWLDVICRHFFFADTTALAIVITPLFVARETNEELDLASKKEKTNTQITLKRCSLCAVLCFLYIAMFYTAVCHNENFMTSTGSAGTLQEVMSEYLMYYRHRGIWGLYNHLVLQARALQEVMSYYWAYYTSNGVWRTLCKDAMSFVDSEGKYRAYWTLGFRTPWMSHSELKSHCRRLSAQWHPDRFFTYSEKLYAEAKYQDIVNACDILKMQKRLNKN